VYFVWFRGLRASFYRVRIIPLVDMRVCVCMYMYVYIYKILICMFI